MNDEKTLLALLASWRPWRDLWLWPSAARSTRGLSIFICGQMYFVFVSQQLIHDRLHRLILKPAALQHANQSPTRDARIELSQTHGLFLDEQPGRGQAVGGVIHVVQCAVDDILPDPSLQQFHSRPFFSM